MEPVFVRWFGDIGIEDVADVGQENASLGETYRQLTAIGVRMPNGFATTAEAHWSFFGETGLDERIRGILAGLDANDLDELQSRGNRVRQTILATALPNALRDAIATAYDRLSEGSAEPIEVMVRSSGVSEPGGLGLDEIRMNAVGHSALIQSCKRAYASLFTDSAIAERANRGIDPAEVAISIGVQRRVRSDLACAGVMSFVGKNGARDVIRIVANDYERDRRISRAALDSREPRIVHEDSAPFPLSDQEVLSLARWAVAIEDHWSAQEGQSGPAEIEWAKDGITGELFVVHVSEGAAPSREERQDEVVGGWIDQLRRRGHPRFAERLWSHYRRARADREQLRRAMAMDRETAKANLEEVRRLLDEDVRSAVRDEPDLEPPRDESARTIQLDRALEAVVLEVDRVARTGHAGDARLVLVQSRIDEARDLRRELSGAAPGDYEELFERYLAAVRSALESWRRVRAELEQPSGSPPHAG